MSPSVGLKSQTTQNQPAPATTVAPAGEQSSATERCMPLIALKAAWTVVQARRGTIRSVNREAVAPGKISSAMTRIAPTASKEATTTMANQSINPWWMAPTRIPRQAANPGSKEVISNSL